MSTKTKLALAQGITFEEIPFDEFVKIPPVHCQRDESLRVNKLRRVVRKSTVPTILEVRVGEYPDGSRVLLDGNTRRALWKSGDKGVVAPEFVRATVYSLTDKKYAEELYYSFDNQGSAKNGAEIITGYYRKLHMSFDTPKLQRGSIGKSVKFALRGHPTIPNDMFTQIAYLKDELIILDRIGCNNFNAAYIAAALMMLKLYGDNQKLASGLHKLNEQVQLGQRHPDGTDDPLKRIVDAFNGVADLGDRVKGNNNNLPEQIGFTLYCLEKYMNNQRIGKNKVKSNVIERTYETFWSWLDDEE